MNEQNEIRGDEREDVRADLEGWNPRYVLWAKKHGLTPEEMAEKDQRDWPGGCMCGFSLWIQSEVKAICEFYGIKNGYDLRLIWPACGDDIQKVFDQWLETRVLL